MNNFSFGCLRLSHVCKQCITNTTNLNERVKTQPNKPNQSNSSPKGILTQLAKIKLTSHTSRITSAHFPNALLNPSGLQGSFDTIQEHLGQEEAFKAPPARLDETNKIFATRKYIRKINGWLDEIPFLGIFAILQVLWLC